MVSKLPKSKISGFNLSRHPLFKDALTSYRILTLFFSLVAYTLIILTFTSASLYRSFQNFYSKATIDPIVLKDQNGNPLPMGDSGISYTISPKIRIELTAPYPPATSVVLGVSEENLALKSPGHSEEITPTLTQTPVPTQTDIPVLDSISNPNKPDKNKPPHHTPTPTHAPISTPTPAPTSTPIPTSTSIPTSTPTSAPTPTPVPITTVSYQLTENLSALESSPFQPYTSAPTIVDYEFKDATLGSKYIFVKFNFSNGHSSNIITRQIDLVPAPTPTPVPSGVTFKTYKGLNFPWGINSKGVSTFRDWLSSKYDEQVTAKSFEEIKGMGVRTVGMWLWLDRMLIKDDKWGTDAYVTKFDPTYKANWESFLKNVVKAKDMEVVVTMFPGAGGEERDPYMIDRDTFIPVLAGNDILGAGVANGDMAIDESPKDGLPDGWTVNTVSAQNSYIYEPGDGTTGSPARDLKLTSDSTSQISVISPKVSYPSQVTLLALSATYKGNLVSFKTIYYDINNKYLGDDFYSPNLGMTNNTVNWTTVTWPSRTVKIPAGTTKIAINAVAGANGTTSIGPVMIAYGARNAKWRNYLQAVKDWVSMYGSSTEYGPAVVSWHGIKEVSDGYHFFVTRDFSKDFYQAIKSTGTTQPVGIDNSPYFRLAVTIPENQPWFNDAADYYSLHIYKDDGVIPDTSKLDKPFILGEFGAEAYCPNGGYPPESCNGSETHLADPSSDWNLNAVSKFYPNGQTAGAKTALGWAWVSNPTIAQHKLDGTNVLGNAGQWIKNWNP